MNYDNFRMVARGPQGQLTTLTFTMRTDDQRSVTDVGCQILAGRTWGAGWTPITVEWLNKPKP